MVTVGLLPPVDVMFPFKVAVVEVTLVAELTVIVGAMVITGQLPQSARQVLQVSPLLQIPSPQKRTGVEVVKLKGAAGQEVPAELVALAVK